jgi:hypothetical protein
MGSFIRDKEVVGVFVCVFSCAASLEFVYAMEKMSRKHLGCEVYQTPYSRFLVKQYQGMLIQGVSEAKQLRCSNLSRRIIRP